MNTSLPLTTDCTFPIYTSCIRIKGRPILPPLMNSLRRQEMAEYRRQAMIAETRIVKRKFEKSRQLCKAINFKDIFDTKPDDNFLDRKYNLEYGYDDQNIFESSVSSNTTKEDELNKNKTFTVSHNLENNDTLTCDILSIETSKNNLQNGKITSSDQILTNIKSSDVISDISDDKWNSSLYYENQENDKQYSSNYTDNIIFNNINSQFDSNTNVPIVINEANNNNSFNLEELNNVCSNENCEQNYILNSRVNENHEIKSNSQHDADIDSIVLSAGQSTDLEKYLDSSAETVKTDSTHNTPSSFTLVLTNDSNISQSNMSLSCTDSSETLVALNVSNEKNDKHIEESVISESHSTISQKDDLNSSQNNNSCISTEENVEKHHIRRSSYTLDGPSPALLLTLSGHECPHFTPTNSPNSSVILNSVNYESDMHSKNENMNVSENQFSKILTDISINNNHNISLNDNNFNKLIEQQKKDFPVSDDNANVVLYKEEKASLLDDIGNMKKTMEDLLHIQELNFENARQKLAKMQEEQMELLLTKQRQQWQLLIEELNLENKQTEKLNLMPSELSREKHEGNDVMNNSISLCHDENAISKVQIFSKINTKDENNREVREFDPEMQAKFNRVSAVVKGYLTRRLMKTERVQNIIQTIKDTLICALKFHQETPIKKGKVTIKDAELHKRLIAQLTSACYELHDIFFKLTTKERMAIIRQSRSMSKEKVEKEEKSSCNISNMESKRRLSSATLKVLERKKKNNNNESLDMRKSSKYYTKAIRRGNAIPNRPPITPPNHKYVHQPSSKQESQKASRKSTVVGNHSSVRKKLLENTNLKK